jgi:hypothetical protein
MLKRVYSDELVGIADTEMPMRVWDRQALPRGCLRHSNQPFHLANTGTPGTRKSIALRREGTLIYSTLQATSKTKQEIVCHALVVPIPRKTGHPEHCLMLCHFPIDSKRCLVNIPQGGNTPRCSGVLNIDPLYTMERQHILHNLVNARSVHSSC